MQHPLGTVTGIADHPVLQAFSPAVREWFASSFPEPTPPQIEGWPHIVNGDHTLICAPTGSGKTLTAFLASIDRLVTNPQPEARTHRTRVLYISPLRALAFDVEKNLRAPLIGIGLAAERLGVPFTTPDVAMRTGDTESRDRQRLIRRPPDLLITTPESLYLMLTSSAAETLQGVETVIIDEIHAIATTKRGAHMSLTLERLEQVTDRPPQRIGLSATQRPLEETARFLGGFTDEGPQRPVRIVDAGSSKQLEIDVVVPVEDMANLATGAAPAGAPDGAERRGSIWPSIYPRVLELVLAHRTTIIFCNARRAAERLAAKLNELYLEQFDTERDGMPETELIRAHHGSLAREQRVIIEDLLKRGELRAIVATSSLELGIDMGAVDLVIQIESPGAVSRGLQRIGRSGHSVGQPSKGTIFPKHRGDLVEAAVVTRRMLDGEIEHSRYLRNPLDVLAQQIVAHVAARNECTVAEVAALVRRSANFHELSDELLGNVLDLLAGRYPSEEFSELRPRIVWDRVNDTIRPRDGSKRLAVTSGGTIPDRGLFGVFLPNGTRVGELDEEMVYESRPGDAFVLGASTWRIEDISFERVIVTPAPGVPAKMPFWHGDRPGRPLELGRAVGAFVREIRELPAGTAHAHLTERYALDDLAASNVVQYLAEQAAATGVVPDDRTIVVERFRDEIGDWRVCLLSPFGTPVHAPWAMAIERRFMERHDLPVETMWGDDGIVIRLPEAADELDIETFLIDPDEIDELVVSSLPGTALFSARFRECAGRALLLPRRRPDKRTPLWQQRQRAADLLNVAAKYPTFPILLETTRECLQDVFDVPALREVLQQLQSRRVRLVHVDTAQSSPMASSLLFNWIAAYMYEGDAPLAERRAAALSLDRDLLRELLGAEELRELLDPGVLADLELELQRLTDGRRARTADELHDVLRRVGDLTAAEADLRCEGPAADMIAELLGARRAIEVAVAGEQRLIAADDAARYRDALGCSLPLGLPTAFTDPVPRPLEELVARYARTHGPFLSADVARRLGAPLERIEGAIAALATEERLVRGEFRPEGVQREWCDPEVLRQLRRRSLATLRREIEPVEQAALARFLPEWHSIGLKRRGPEALVETIAQLSGAPLVASTLERDVLPARLDGYRPTMLDELCIVRRRGVGRRRFDRRARRPAAALLRRSGRHAGPWLGGGRCAGRPAARGDPRCPRRSRRRVLGSDPRSRPGRHRRRTADGAVGPGLGRRGHQRLDRTVTGMAGGRERQCQTGQLEAHAVRATTTPRSADPRRAAGRRRTLELGLPAAPTGADIDRGRPCVSPPAAGTPWCGHPRGCAGRRRGGRVRRRVSRVEGARGARPGAARLLRGRVGRRPVRPARSRRPAPRRTRVQSAAFGSGVGAGSHRPRSAVRRRPGVAGALRPRGRSGGSLGDGEGDPGRRCAVGMVRPRLAPSGAVPGRP